MLRKTRVVSQFQGDISEQYLNFGITSKMHQLALELVNTAESDENTLQPNHKSISWDARTPSAKQGQLSQKRLILPVSAT